MKVLTALLAGLVFGLGIAISGMMNPAKVLNFFDIAGSFDPSLIFVMGGALITTAVGYRFVFGKLPSPVFAAEFAVPKSRIIDAPLVLGSAAFGVGWGISGFVQVESFRPWGYSTAAHSCSLRRCAPA